MNHYSLPIKVVTALKHIMMSIDQGKPVILVLLDLSAAFHTFDHNVLFSRLKDMVDLSGKVLELFRSYLEQRSQRVSVHGTLSDIHFLLSGVPNGSAKNLGIIFDQCINMYEHVTSVCRVAYYHCKNSQCLKAFLIQEALVNIVHTFVTSRKDYCNSLLYGISDYNINRLQRIQNSAARIVTNT